MSGFLSKQGDCPKIMVGVPSGDIVHADFAMSLASMVGVSAAQFKDDYQIVGYLSEKGSDIAVQRNTLVITALNYKEVTHLLMIDSDMTFPTDALRRLVMADKEIIGANAMRKRAPFGWAGKKVDDPWGWELGMAFMLIQLDVFRKVEFPWFDRGHRKTENGWIPVSEDIFFCRKAGAAGYQINCDQVLSQQIGHLGTIEISQESLQRGAEAESKALEVRS